MFFNVIIYPSLLADDIKHLQCSSTKEKKIEDCEIKHASYSEEKGKSTTSVTTRVL